jgi:hypothetical protein
MKPLSEEDWELLRADLDARSEPPDPDDTGHGGPVVLPMGRVELPPERIAELADMLLSNWPEPPEGRRP